MNELINALGFLDYRDFLAANKYIIESKKSSNYHVYARGQILAAAMNKYEYMISGKIFILSSFFNLYFRPNKEKYGAKSEGRINGKKFN